MIQSREEGLEAVAGISDVLRQHSAESEIDRSLHADVVDALRQSGLARLLTPKKYGGAEVSISLQTEVGTALAKACPAAAWVNMVCAAHDFVVGRFSEQCQEEIFGADTDVLIPGSLAPQGQVTLCEGGFILEGQWQFGSGVDHGPWLLLGALGHKDENGKRGPLHHVMVPRDEIEVLDTWHTMGMRGSGSHDLKANALFVPSYRAMPTAPLFVGTFDGDVPDLYRQPVLAGLSTLLAGVILGIGESFCSHFLEMTKVRREIYNGQEKAFKSGIQTRTAESLAEIDQARRLIAENGACFDALYQSLQAPLPAAERVALRWRAGYAAELCRRAVERLFAVSGAHAIYQTSPLQRLYRDLNTACHHAIIDFDTLSEMRGQALLGIEDNIAFA